MVLRAMASAGTGTTTHASAHVAALDGFRGAAILAVILFHYTWLSCGWAGVQVFFVLSGFLITSILVQEREQPFLAYAGRFYWRRSLRIFPLYFGYLGALTLVFLLSGAPAIFARYWPELYTYTLNFDRLRLDYPNNRFFGHFWSLAVEEQFYLLWPALVFILSRRAFRWFVIGLLVGSPVIRALTAAALSRTSNAPDYLGQAIYSLTFTQLDAFAAGAACALFRDRLDGLERRLFVGSTLVLLAAGQINALITRGAPAFDSSLGYNLNMFAGGQHIWGYSLIDLWAASLLLVACRSTAVSRWLSAAPLLYLGRISYGMYVFHPIVQRTVAEAIGVQHGLANLAAFLGYLTLVILIASASYRWCETPFLRLKDRRFRHGLAGGAPPAAVPA